MVQKKKIKYEKPQSMEIGKAASVLGASCSTGVGAADGCPDGENPQSVYVCEGGSVADSYCANGGDAGFPGCFAGTNQS